jgi:quercetin dioxygenase-like cupin family protein
MLSPSLRGNRHAQKNASHRHVRRVRHRHCPLAQEIKSPVSPSPVKRTVIGKIEVPGSNYEVITAMVELAPGFRAGRHFHPGIVDAQILDGEFMLALDGQPEKTYTAGQSLEVSLKAIHNEGAVGAKPAKLIAIYMVEKGQPLVQPVK